MTNYEIDDIKLVQNQYLRDTPRFSLVCVRYSSNSHTSHIFAIHFH